MFSSLPLFASSYQVLAKDKPRNSLQLENPIQIQQKSFQIGTEGEKILSKPAFASGGWLPVDPGVEGITFVGQLPKLLLKTPFAPAEVGICDTLCWVPAAASTEGPGKCSPAQRTTAFPSLSPDLAEDPNLSCGQSYLLSPL